MVGPFGGNTIVERSIVRKSALTTIKTLFSNGLLQELVELKDEFGELASGDELSKDELNRWIASTFPIQLLELGPSPHRAGP